MICVNKILNRKEQQTKTRGQVPSLTTQANKKKDVGDGAESTSIGAGLVKLSDENQSYRPGSWVAFG